MFETVMLLLHMSIFVVFITLAMRHDVTERRVPNRLVVTMAITGVVSLVFIGPGSIAVLPTIGAAIAVLCVGWILNALGFWGGGDAKLAAAATIWLGPVATVLFIAMALFIGAVQAIITLLVGLMIAYRTVPGARWRPRLMARGISLPYALSIGTASIIAMALQIGAVI